MLRTTLLLALLSLPAISASAATYTYGIDHGTPGVIASESKMARLVIIASGDCSNIPYEVIADGVKSLSGHFDLKKPLSLPLDFTTVTLSCDQEGVKASISKEKGVSLF
ncbi:MAG: hypothetical protein R8K50_11265 [Mariprofundus sp.]